MYGRRCRLAVTTIVLLGLSAPAALPAPSPGNTTLTPFIAQYKLKKGFITLARGKFQLQDTGGGCYLYSGTSQTSGVVSLFRGDKIQEESRLCVAEGEIRPRFYRFYHKGGKKDHNYTLTFDWGHLSVTIKRQGKNKSGQRQIPPGAQDDLSMQADLRRRLRAAGGALQGQITEHLVTRNHVRTYQFRVQGRETLDTEAGSYETIRLARQHPGDKQVRLWFAPKLDYLPVKIERSGPGLTQELTGLPKPPAGAAPDAQSRSKGDNHLGREVRRHRRGSAF